MRLHLLLLLVVIAGVTWVVAFLNLQGSHLPDAPNIATPQDVVESMLELAKVGPEDRVYDLGCGDGGIVVTAARKHGCKAIGFDIDPECVRAARANAARNGVQDRVAIREADIFKLDLRQATVITLYLKQNLNTQLIPQLDQLGPGVRIVSHKFSMPGATPDKIVSVHSPEEGYARPVYLWVTPLKHSTAASSTYDAPFPYDGPPWTVVAAASAIAVTVFLVLTQCRNAVLAASVGAVSAATLAWWALGCGRGYMMGFVQLVCSSVFVLVGGASGWLAASVGKGMAKREQRAGRREEEALSRNASAVH